MIPTLVMTSDKTKWALNGLVTTLTMYCHAPADIYIFGFEKPEVSFGQSVRFISLGKMDEWPWSDAFLEAMNYLEREGHTHFWFLMDDYWLVRDVDAVGLLRLYDYITQHPEVAKIDLCQDRLYVNGGGAYLYGNNDYETFGHFNLIKSPNDSPYHMSLWSGLFSIAWMKKVVVPGESAQQLEMAGTPRLAALEEAVVLGTRQGPVQHTNVHISSRGIVAEGLPTRLRLTLEMRGCLR